MTWKGWEDFKAPHVAASLKPKQPSKYHAQRTEVEGIVFDSKREAGRYVLLRTMQDAGEISGLTVQPRLALHALSPQGALRRIGDYVADFSYVRRGECVYEDAKGVRTALYQWKRKHVEAEYGISIVEV